jgi:hypothetical protein
MIFEDFTEPSKMIFNKASGCPRRTLRHCNPVVGIGTIPASNILSSNRAQKVVPNWAKPRIFMKHQRRFETAHSTQRVQIEALIKSLRRYVDLLDVDIGTEERSAQTDRMDDPNYPQLARHLRARRNNLAATLELLQGRLEAPAGMQLVATSSAILQRPKTQVSKHSATNVKFF